MRRPMVFAATAFGGGIATAYRADIHQGVWLLCLVTSALSLFVITFSGLPINTMKKGILYCCIFFIGAAYVQWELSRTGPLFERVDKNAEVTGMVTRITQKEEGFQMVVDTSQELVLVSYYGRLDSYRSLAGKTVFLQGEIQLPQSQRNPKCFDYRQYLQACGIRVQMTASAVTISREKGNLLWKTVSEIKGRFEEKLEIYTDKVTKGLLMAMMFGDKSMLDQDLYEDFQKNGTAHILAVSGLHVGILYSVFVYLWRGKKEVFFYSFVLTALLLYTALAEFSPSVVRAAVMVVIHLGAKILHQRYDLLSAAAFTFLFMLCMNPVQLFHTGFQLSFLAIASLGVILPFIGRMYQGVFLSSLAIQAGMLPYTAYVFNYVSLGAFFVNLPVIFLSGILLPGGILLLLCSYGPAVFFQIGAAILQQGCRWLIWINDFFYANGATSFDVTSPPLFFLAAYYGFLFGGVSEKGRILFLRHKWRTLAAGAALILGLSGIGAVSAADGFSRAQLVFVDVGQGDCIHVKTPEGKNYLLDGGGNIRYDVGIKIVKPYLLKNGVKKLDGAFVTHLHEDHYGGIRSLAQQGMVDVIGVYEANRTIEQRLKKETGAEFLYLYKGQRVQLGETVYLDILAPEKKVRADYEKMIKDQEDENASSLIMKLKCGDISVLITGDIDQEGEKRLVDSYKAGGLRSDILKVAHHGSKYSSSDVLLDAVSPQIAVFQVGKNNFGHPAESVIEKYKQRGIMIYRNDSSGAIGVFSKKGGQSISIQKMIE